MTQAPHTQDQAAREELKRILTSRTFGASPQLCAFLQFVTDKTLIGEAACLKAYTIATDALGRPDDFDPQADPIVRVQARRLRMLLDQYYMKEDAGRELKIELVPGSYVPNFVSRRDTQKGTGKECLESKTERVQELPVAKEPTPQRHGANRLLILEDDPDMRAVLRQVGEAANFYVIDAGDANQFWVGFKALRPTHLIIDMVVPGTDGIEVLRELANYNCTANILLVSGVDPRVLTAAERLGRYLGVNIVQTVQKPFDIDVLEAALTKTMITDICELDDLRKALSNSEFRLFYQPKIRVDNGGDHSIDGVEALIRWEHPDKGMIAPDEFIPALEENGLIDSVTEWIVDAVVGQMQAWREMGLDLSVAINVSASSLTNLEFPDEVSARLAAGGLPAKLLTVEITEAAAVGEDLDVIDILSRFRLKGIQLSMDDFGTGYSTLLGLFRMPFSELKIDRSFVCELEKSGDARCIVKAVIDLCKNLNLKVCAEGVETAENVALLQQMGCEVMQGFYFSKPLPAHKLEQFIRENYPSSIEVANKVSDVSAYTS